MKQKIDWFSRGRDAFTEGKPCFIRDGRISGADRTAWYDGWKHQRNLNTQPAAAADLAEAIAGLQSIRESLLPNAEPSHGPQRGS